MRVQEQLSKETTVREQREAQLEVTQQALAAEQEAAAAAVEASTNSLKVRCPNYLSMPHVAPQSSRIHVLRCG